MPVTLEAPIILPRTVTDPILDESPRGQEVAGPPQDSAIIVIENPITTEGKFMGMLFGTVNSGPLMTTFRNVDYFRLDLREERVEEYSNFAAVSVKQGLIDGSTYQYLETGDLRRRLPNPTTQPYKPAFLEDSLFAYYRAHFIRGDVFPDALREVNFGLAKRVSDFELDTKGNLLLPNNYASLKP